MNRLNWRGLHEFFFGKFFGGIFFVGVLMVVIRSRVVIGVVCVYPYGGAGRLFVGCGGDR